MSMLQQILDTMHVDQEILDALEEEQKQILFIKMREEQVKRWKEREAKMEKDSPPALRDPNGRHVRWLKGADGEVWVWVMGEHKDDLSIEEIMEQRAREEARKLAEQEMLKNIHFDELTLGNELTAYPSEDEQTLKQQLSMMSVNTCDDRNITGITNNAMRESMYEDADNMVEPLVVVTLPPSKHNLLSDGSALKTPQSALLEGGLNHTEASSESHLSIFCPTGRKDGLVESVSQSFNSPSQVESGTAETPVRPPRLKHLAQKNAAVVASRIVDDGTKVAVTSPPLSSVLSANHSANASNGSATLPPNLHTSKTKPFPFTSFRHQTGASGGKDVKSNEPSDNASFARSPAAQDYKHVAPILVKQEANSPAGPSPTARQNYATVPASAGRVSSASVHGEVNWKSGDVAKLRTKTQDAKSAIAGTDNQIAKRQSEIYEMIREYQQNIAKQAEAEAERELPVWEEQEKRAREAEAQIRQIAQKAREEHRKQSLRTSTSILPALRQAKTSSLREAIKNVPKPPKPKSRQAIVDWFRIDELHRGTGLDPKTHRPAPWFHGIISRNRAEELLRGKPAGSFLVRVSERIWGYTVSYVVGDGVTKHFLIERIPEGYQFLGTNQVVHNQLFDLIAYHETAPVTVKGNEILKWAVGQTTSPPDYSDLIQCDSPALLRNTSITSSLPAAAYRQL
ncbi:hypothetical protein AB6A40_006617 [Gnathostoma spinigerum]|uniref:SH2 domain-containing protein n=1 Tax=Gnathostoma spinigerum TaxID=75299 RepID=A0ABD6EJ36_9BILA